MITYHVLELAHYNKDKDMTVCSITICPIYTFNNPPTHLIAAVGDGKMSDRVNDIM